MPSPTTSSCWPRTGPATRTSAASSRTPTSTATTTSRASTASYLARTAQGLIGLSACLNGEIPRALEMDDWELARRLTGEYRDILGPDNFFLELQDHGLPEQRRLTEQLLRLGPEVGLPLVATNDLHYVHREQARGARRRCCASARRPTSTRPTACASRPRSSTSRRPPRWRRSSRTCPEAISNTRRIAEMMRPAAALRAAAPAALPGARRPHRRELAARRVRARPRASATARSRPSSTSASTTSWASSSGDGLRGLLPHRGRLHRASPASRASPPPAAAAPRARS